MAIAPLQLPTPIQNAPINWSGLDKIGDAVAGYRQRSALADALPGMFGGTPQVDNSPMGQPQSAAPTSSGTPASIRTNNPGAQWMGPTARAFGAQDAIPLPGGNNAAVFPSPVQGAAAQFSLLATKYAGMPLGAAIAKWSGGNNAAQYTSAVSRATGLSADTPLTPSVLSNPQTAIPLAKAMAQMEAGRPYPMTDDQWMQAHQLAFSGAGQSPSTALAFNGPNPPLASATPQDGQPQPAPTAAQPAQVAQAAPQQGLPAPTQQGTPDIPPQTMARLQAMIRAGGSAQAFAMAILQKYVVPQTPVVVGEGAVALNPVTGAVIGRGQQKSYPVAAGGALVTPGQPGQGTAGGASYTNENGKLDDKTLTGMAQRYLETGDNQIITDAGNGTMGAINRAALNNRIEQMRANSGQSGADIIGKKGESETQVKASKDFGTGPQGNTVRSFNVFIDHISLARQLAGAMQNGDVRVINELRNVWRKEFGSDLPTNLDAAKQVVSSELQKAVQGTDGALGDRIELQKPLDPANSWDQLSGVIDKVYLPLAVGQIKGLRQQYTVNTKNKPEQFDAMLSERAKGVMNGQPAPAAQTLPKITDRNQANAAIAAARKWIASGKDPKAVNAALQQMGIPPLGQ